MLLLHRFGRSGKAAGSDVLFITRNRCEHTSELREEKVLYISWLEEEKALSTTCGHSLWGKCKSDSSLQDEWGQKSRVGMSEMGGRTGRPVLEEQAKPISSFVFQNLPRFSCAAEFRLHLCCFAPFCFLHRSLSFLLISIYYIFFSCNFNNCLFPSSDLFLWFFVVVFQNLVSSINLDFYTLLFLFLASALFIFSPVVCIVTIM